MALHQLHALVFNRLVIGVHIKPPRGQQRGEHLTIRAQRIAHGRLQIRHQQIRPMHSTLGRVLKHLAREGIMKIFAEELQDTRIAILRQGFIS